MVDIIRRGLDPNDPNTKYRLECRECKSILEAKFSEFKFIHDQKDGDYYELKCPVCLRCSYIFKSKLMEHKVDDLTRPHPSVPLVKS